MSRIDPLAKTSWGFAWDYNVIDAVEAPAGNVVGLMAVREGKKMERPESKRAFNMWKTAFRPEDIAHGYDGMRLAYDRFLSTAFPPPADARVHELELGGVRVLRVTKGAPTDGTSILHFHGGGYMIGSARGSVEYASRLASSLSGECYSVDYRLAPEHPYPAAIDDAIAAYRGLLGKVCRLRRYSSAENCRAEVWRLPLRWRSALLGIRYLQELLRSVRLRI